MIRLDEAWLAAHPLPRYEEHTNKNDRGRVTVVGGSAFVPGALRLTGEAALRAGAGKLQLGTMEAAAGSLGLWVPEAGVFALPVDDEGELSPAAGDLVVEHASSCDALVLGPGMRSSTGCNALVRHIVDNLPASVSILLDAAAIAAAKSCPETVRSHRGAMLLTPHAGEMASLTGLDVEEVEREPERTARNAAAEFDAVVMLKSANTIIAAPGQDCVFFDGGTPGLATGGSGDVLAGVAGGLLARGAEPLIAAAWAAWVHGAAGRALTRDYGGPGLLGRELLPLLPALLNGRN